MPKSETKKKKINNLNKQKRIYFILDQTKLLRYRCKSSIVAHGGSLEIRLTVPLNGKIILSGFNLII